MKPIKQQFKLIFLIAILAGSSPIYGSSAKESTPQEKEPSTTRSIPVTFTKAKMEELTVTVTALGTLESPHTPRISAEVAGKLLIVTVDEGDRVKPGQVLAKLDTELYQIELTKVEADLQRLQAVISNQQTNVQRLYTLLKKQTVPQHDYDGAQTELAISEAQVLGLQARLKEIHYYLGKSNILSPIQGAIRQRLVTVGDFVQPGTPLFQLVVTDQLRARLFLPETIAPQIKIDLPVTLSLGMETTSVITATISRLNPVLETGNRALEVLVEFTNEQDWKPGYTAKGLITLEKHHSVLVPEISVVKRLIGEVVYLVKNNQATQRSVKTGIRKDGLVEILEGVSVGEAIVVDGAHFLSDGATIDIRGEK